MRLSYSQVSTLRKCGHSWKLKYHHGLRGRPSWAQAGGTAFHEIVELTEVSNHGFDVQIPTAEAALDAAAEALVENNDWTLEDIRPTGRKSKQWPEGRNRQWWLENIPAMVNGYKQWAANTPWKLALDDIGRPLVEVQFEFEMGGDIVRGFIDQVREYQGQYAVVDLKTGREPASVDQLGLYRIGLKKATGLDATAGWFFLATESMTSIPADLTAYTEDRINWEYGLASERVARGDLQPNPDDHCSWCDVRDWCIFQGGSRASEVSLPWPVTR